MTLTPEQAARRAAIAELYAFGSGEITMEAIGAALNPPITKQRVSQIIKAAKLDERRERCRSGVHGETWTGVSSASLGDDEWTITTTWCRDCEGIVSQVHSEPMVKP